MVIKRSETGNMPVSLCINDNGGAYDKSNIAGGT